MSKTHPTRVCPLHGIRLEYAGSHRLTCPGTIKKRRCPHVEYTDRKEAAE